MLFRSRSINTPRRYEGTGCGETIVTESCNNHVCPVDCMMDVWQPWSNCSANCGGGTQTRTRGIIRESVGGGIPCGETSETRACNTARCCNNSDYTNCNNCNASPCQFNGENTTHGTKQCSVPNTNNCINNGPSYISKTCTRLCWAGDD